MVEHFGTVRLETERLILRKIYMGDIKDVYEWESDERVNTYLASNRVGKPLYIVQDLVGHWNYRYKDNSYYNWGIELKDEKKLIGHISVAELRENVEIGYSINPNYWGKGYATEALKTVSSFLIDKVGYDIITAYHMIENEGSGRVLIKSGFEYVGIVKKDCGNGYPIEVKKYVMSRKIS